MCLHIFSYIYLKIQIFYYFLIFIFFNFIFHHIFYFFSKQRSVDLRAGGFWVFSSILMFETLVGVAMGLAVGAAVPSIG